ncbi:hypothetical protein GIB67_042622 [Kingdonia uniflora]|uniref:Uncharacterized protein n=1 Tax=Kingdonia uniflora TaxID=39325 RepID=A0A7J7M1C5_9MAGN|nr:hypothetical protein GIB67_042622 [Kingdonia uniflora]
MSVKRASEECLPSDFSSLLGYNGDDDICGIHLKLEASCKEWVSTAATKCQEQQDERLLDRPLSSETLTTLCLQFLFLDNAEMGKDLEIGVPGIPDLEHDSPSEKLSTNLPGANQESKKDNRQLDKSWQELMSKEPIEEVTGQVAYPMGSVVNSNNVSEASKNISMVPEIKEKAISNAGNLTSVELSSKRLRGHGDTRFTTHENHNILRRSDLSAFSREEVGLSLDKAEKEVLGHAAKVVLTKEVTTIVGNESTQDAVAEQNYEKKKLNERIAKISCGVAVIQVGADIVKRALSYLLKLIAKNIGNNRSVVMEKVLFSDNFKYGYNAATGKYEDLMASYYRSYQSKLHFKATVLSTVALVVMLLFSLNILFFDSNIGINM